MRVATERGLNAVVAALEVLADGERPHPADVLAGALALEHLCAAGGAARETLDAAAGLKGLASGGTLDLDAAGLKARGPPAHAHRRRPRMTRLIPRHSAQALLGRARDPRTTKLYDRTRGADMLSEVERTTTF